MTRTLDFVSIYIYACGPDERRKTVSTIMNEKGENKELIRYLEDNEISDKECHMDHPFIFISYAHDDDTAEINGVKGVIRKIFSELYDSGFNLWIDVANLPTDGHGWETAAQEALQSPNCKLLLYFRSHTSLKKNTIKRELESFVNHHDRTSDNIIVVDLSKKEDIHTTEYLESLKEKAEADGATDRDKGDYENCEAICDVVSSHCNALRYRMDFENFNAFLGALIRKIKERGFQQNFSLQEKIEFILDGTFHVVLNPDQDRVMQTYRVLLSECLKDPAAKRTLIIDGRPGVGKSVLAMSMLNEYIRLIKESGNEYGINLDSDDELGFLVVSKNKAPRDAYKGILNLREEANKEANKEDSKKVREEKEQNRENYAKLLKRAEKVFKGSGGGGLVKKYSEPNCVKVIIADEAHRLTSSDNYDGYRPQPDIIVNAAQLSVFFVDENQIVSYEDFGTKENLKESCEKYKSQCFVEKLHTQMRCGGADSYIEWVDCLMEVGDGDKASTVKKAREYDLQVFDTPNELFDAIVKRNKEDSPARVTAGICWPWQKEGKSNNEVKDVVIGDFKKSWNLDYTGKKINFASDPDSIDQIGSIHTVQGLEFTYAGVIFGEDIDYDDEDKNKNKLIINYEKIPKDCRVMHGSGVIEKQGKSLKKEAKKAATREEYHEKMKEAEAIIEECERKKSSIIRNIYRVLLTRGTKGCYIYCVNPNLQKYIKEQVKLYNDSFYRL